MALEAGSFVEDLVITNPLSGDFKSEGDDHLRLLKTAIKATFPGMAGAAWRVQDKAGYTVLATDNMSVIRSTGAGSIALTAAATLGNKFCFAYFNSHSAAILIDPNGAELINGGASLSVEAGNGALVFCSGTAFYAIAVAASASFGKQTIYLPASSWTPRTTNGPAPGLVELATNKVMLPSLDFDQTTSEAAQFLLFMPKSWDEGTLTFKAVWTTTAGAGGATVVWKIGAVALSDDDPLDSAIGTEISVSDILLAANDVHITAESTAITIAGTPNEGDLVVLQIARDISDTLANDAKLLGVHLYITTNASTDV